MTQPRKRLRRNTTNDDHATIDSLTRSPSQPSLEIEQNPHHTPEQPPINLPNSTIAKLDLDRIRTELLDENHHANFSESDYWDESHNWSDNSASDEYWNFLGLYE